MKALLLTAIFLSLPLTTQAAEIIRGKYLAAEGVIELQVRYGGGCKEHRFELQMGGCLESMPVQCAAQLVDLTKDDFCEAIVGDTLRFSLADYGLDNDYYSGASIRIQGDNGSSFSLRLPR